MSEPNETTKHISYALSDYEELAMNIVKLGDFMVMGIMILQPSTPNEALDQDLIASALQHLQRRHPMLRAYQDGYDQSTGKFHIKIPTDYDSNPAKYSAMIDMDCSNINDGSQRNRDEMIKLLDVFNDIQFQNGPGNLIWRLKAIQFQENQVIKYALGLVVQLQITDGIGITALSLELVNIINALKKNRTCDEMLSQVELVDSLHEICKSKGIFGPEQQRRVAELAAKKPVNFILNENLKSPNESGTKIYIFPVDKEVSGKLLSKAREHGLRLTGFLTASAISALNDLYIENNLPPIREFSAAIPANMRIRYQPNMNLSTLSFQVCVAHIDRINFDSTDLWKESKSVHTLIEEATDIKSGSMFSYSHNEPFVQAFNKIVLTSPTVDEARRLANRDHDCDLLFSNIGQHVSKTKSVKDDAFTLNEIYFGDSVKCNPLILPALMFHTGYWKDQIMIQLSGNTSSIGVKYLNRYIELFKQTLLKSA